MKGIFKAIYNAITQSKKDLSAKSEGSEKVAEKLPSLVENQQVDRCRRILSYWLDFELFDVPEVPSANEKDLMSLTRDDFIETWQKKQPFLYQQERMELTEDSRLLVMFQCHWAGYLIEEDERSPNFKVPRTYLVAQAFIPTWHDESKQFVWCRSEEDQDLTVNLAVIRTLIRRCPPNAAKNMTLPEWVEARLESIETILEKQLQTSSVELFTTDSLYKCLNKINRELSVEFWPDEQSKQMLREQAQPMETQFAKQKSDYDKDKLISSKDGRVTFRWRFSYYPDGNEQQQLGPFFVDDLKHILSQLDKKEREGLSKPLQSYLLGNFEQKLLPEANGNGELYRGLTNRALNGRWPENPRFGLSMLQTVAVNVAKDVEENPVVAVNGPPGTGKTTLLKDVIADRFVTRTIKLLAMSEDKDWVSKAETSEWIMSQSMLVASSNNKAVENISKELPSMSNIHKEFADDICHFREVAPNGDWGLFCAVLGNSSNRKKFKVLLKNLKNHLKYGRDIFGLRLFVFNLKKGQGTSAKAVAMFLENLVNFRRILLLIADINQCHASKKYQGFFDAWKNSLEKLEKEDLSIEDVVNKWQQMTAEQYETALSAFEAFKKQWFARKLGDHHFQNKLKNVQEEFLGAKGQVSELFKAVNNGEFSNIGLDALGHLMNSDAYECLSDEDQAEAERRIHLSSPLGCEKLNHARSKMFIAALRLNEVLIEDVASQFEQYWDDLDQLIDGRLESNERVAHHQELWSVLFLFFPVVSTSLSSVENQFRQMQKKSGFGLVMVDESGQAVNYHVAGLLQRCRQAILVGDPIQLEPVVTLPGSLDRSLARDFLAISTEANVHTWEDDYLVSQSSAQIVADNAGRYMANIGQRKVGIPLLVHRRCSEPMFSIANKIAYDNRMILASGEYTWQAIQSGWIHVEEAAEDIKCQGYINNTEAKKAIELVQFLATHHPDMTKGGVYIITPFTLMKKEIASQWRVMAKNTQNHPWMIGAYGSEYTGEDVAKFANSNIGTVHTFQGKEASTVIICSAASRVRQKGGGITWVNSKPNLLNVAVTRSKHHLFVIGNVADWEDGTLSSELQGNGMQVYSGLESFKSQSASSFSENCTLEPQRGCKSIVSEFDFG